MLTEEYRIARPGRVKALGGVMLDVTAAHLQSCVDCLAHMVAQATAAQGAPTYPVGKIDHIDTPDTPILGDFRSLRIDPATGWMIGSFRWASPELMEWGHSRLGRAVSMEIDFNVEVYGKQFAARLVDVALLPAEALPAMPGAGSMRAVASAATAGLRVRLTCGEDDEKASSAATTTEEGEIMDEATKAAIAQINEALSGISAAVTALASKVDAMTTRDETEMQAREAAAKEAATAADAASLEAFTAALSAATTAGTVTQGEGEELAALAATLPIEGRAKLAASFGKRGTPAVPPENLKNQPAPLVGEAKAAEIQKHIRAKLSAEPGDYTRAVLAVRREHPELFAGAAEEVK
jgi:hypothetical protein